MYNSVHILPVAGRPVKASRFQRHDSHVSLVTTNLVVEEGIPNLFCNSRHGLDIVLTFLVVLDVDAIAKHVGLIPDQPEGAGGNQHDG